MIKKLKDPVSALTHIAGALFSIVGLVILIVTSAATKRSAWDIVSCTIFGCSLILLYSASGIYHSINSSEKTNRILRKLDHIMIYFLIAGSYTPIALGPLRGPWGWSIFGVIWGLAIAGLFLTLFWFSAPRWLTTSIYIVMGWIVLIAAFPMISIFKDLNAFGSLSWLLLEGILYTIGGVLYALKWPKFKNKHFGFHELFHVFVMFGSLSHFWFVYHCLIRI